MPRIHVLASAVALAICSTAAAQAQDFTGVISFGDSLSDAGNVAALNGLPPGNSFTTNPDPVAVQLIASAFGFNQTNISPLIPGSSGTNYAYGGACVRANSATFTCGLSPGAFSITTQLNTYLAANGGHADSHALFTMWGGANDIFTYAGLAGAGVITPAQAQGGTVVSAQTEGALIDTLHAAGASNIIVFNLPDIGKTPQFFGTASQASITGLVLTFNGQLNASMSGKTGIIPVDTFGLFNEIVAHPADYGFTNTTTPACGVGSSSVACGPVGSPLPFHYADGTNETFVFADGVHPTGGAHSVLADYVLAEISAPSYISMLAEAPMHVFDTHTRAVDNQMQADMARTREDGSLRTFANVDYSNQRFDAGPTSPETHSHNSTLTIGGDFHVNSAISVGLASSVGYEDASFAGGGGYRQTEPLLSAYAIWHAPYAYVSFLGAVGQLNFNGVERDFALGTATRTESGDTSGSHAGFELAGGWFFNWGDMKSGPYASIAHQRVRVGSYSERSSDSSAMTFGRQERDSTVSTIGWQLGGDSKMFEGNIHPFARVAWQHESDDDIGNVSAGLVGLNGTFTMPGFQPDSSWWTAELGMSADLGDNFTGYAAYNGRFGDQSQRIDSVNLGLKWSF